jgi:hypothetical protein
LSIPKPATAAKSSHTNDSYSCLRANTTETFGARADPFRAPFLPHFCGRLDHATTTTTNTTTTTHAQQHTT